YLAPSERHVLNLWVRSIGKADDRMVTRDTLRGIRLSSWAYDSRHVLYFQDRNGDENQHLYSVDVTTGETRDLTPQEGVRAQDLMLDEHHPDEALVGVNARDKHVFDVHRLRLSTAEDALDTRNPGDVQGWRVDANFVVRAALAAIQADGSTVLRVRD